jgi:hypothetical protein
VRLLRYRLSAAIVLGALLATGAVFLFARPKYTSMNEVSINMSKFPAPSEASGGQGWTWPTRTPGFRPGQKEEGIELSGVGPAQLESARVAASSAGIDPNSLRVLRSMQWAPGSDAGPAEPVTGGTFTLFITGSNKSGKTCVGVVMPNTKVSFFCPDTPGAHRLGSQLAFVFARVRRYQSHAHALDYLVLIGVARGDVSRIVLSQPGFYDILYEHSFGWWGTFEMGVAVGPRAGNHLRQTTLRLYGKRGLIETVPIRFTRPGMRLIALTP